MFKGICSITVISFFLTASLRVLAFESVPGEYLIKLKGSGGDSNKRHAEVLSRFGGAFSLVESSGGVIRLRSTDVSVVMKTSESSTSKSVKSDIKKIKELLGDEVAYVEPNYIYRISRGSPRPNPPPENPPPENPPPPNTGRRDRAGVASVFPNDPEFSRLWGLANAKQIDNNNQAGDGRADVWAPQAWNLFKGSKEVIVAVIDTGVDYKHPDLIANMWSDGKSFGYNAITGSNDPMDDHMHGTHCAGTIGAVGSNSTGVTGVNWNVRIMAIKFMDSRGSGSTADAVKGIRWAVDNGAHILSNSWGGGGFSQALEDAVTYARDKGVLFVAAAGNDGANIDSRPTYPASLKVDNVIAVAATDNQDKIASFSNFGAKSVHLGAPGVGILSTVPGSGYKAVSGTSMAAPHVAGGAALLLGFRKSFTYKQLKDRILTSAEPVSALKSKTTSGGRLNLYDMLTGPN